MTKVVGVRFKRGAKIYDFDAGLFVLSPQDLVIVETEHGMAMGEVVRPPVRREESPPERENEPSKGEKAAREPLKRVFRLATEEDIKQVQDNIRLEGEAFQFCQERIRDRKMEMNLVQVECLFDRSKIIFYFTADGRLDFRDLVRDLVGRFRTRIEMRQIGVRHEAKLLGGLGSCGRELCCATFLRDFEPVSVKMAKEQNLSLNPTKISGLCGRLMCCLTYEFDAYKALKKGLPKLGKRFTLQCGLSGKVIRQNVLRRQATLILEDGREVTGTPEELDQVEVEAVSAPAPPKEPKRPPLPKSKTDKSDKPGPEGRHKPKRPPVNRKRKARKGSS